MKKIKISKMILISLIFVLFMGLFQITSNAATVGNIYFKAINNKDSQPIANLEVSVYQVGIKDEDNNFEFAEQFKDCKIDIDDLSETNLENLKSYAKQHATPLISKTTDADGNFELENIDLGVYLFVQENETEKFTMQTMLVTVPDLTAESGLQYDITVKPKIINKKIVDDNDPKIIDDPTLPYTGVFTWQVPALVIAGIIIFCIAWLKVYSSSKKKVN